MSEFPPLDDELESLLGPARAIPVAPADLRSHVLRSTLAAVGTAPSAPVEAPISRWTRTHTYAAAGGLALGLILGAALTVAVVGLEPEAQTPAERPTEVETPSVAPIDPVVPAVEATSTEMPEAEEGRDPVSSAEEPRRSHRTPAAPVMDEPAVIPEHDEHDEHAETWRSQAAERRLVDAARASLVRGNGAAALRGLDRYDASFDDGQMQEEAHALRVRALVTLGRIDEARRESERFSRRFPRSPLRRAVEESVR